MVATAHNKVLFQENFSWTLRGRRTSRVSLCRLCNREKPYYLNKTNSIIGCFLVNVKQYVNYMVVIARCLNFPLNYAYNEKLRDPRVIYMTRDFKIWTILAR